MRVPKADKIAKTNIKVVVALISEIAPSGSAF
jgi:hypothetical protein